MGTEGVNVLANVGHDIEATYESVDLGPADDACFEEGQVGRDLARERFTLNGRPVTGDGIGSEINSLCEEHGHAGEMRRALLRALSRTGSGGDAYFSLLAIFHQMLGADAVVMTPADLTAAAIAVTVSGRGQFRIVTDTNFHVRLASSMEHDGGPATEGAGPALCLLMKAAVVEVLEQLQPQPPLLLSRRTLRILGSAIVVDRSREPVVVALAPPPAPPQPPQSSPILQAPSQAQAQAQAQTRAQAQAQAQVQAQAQAQVQAQAQA
jgi:hypothetical protein